MSVIQEEQLEEAIVLLKKFLEGRPERSVQHEKEHEFIRKMMEEYEKRIAFWDSVQRKLASMGIFALLSAITSAVGFTLMHWIKGDL